MKILTVFSRYRLLVNILALAAALSAFAYSAPTVVADPGWTCETGCVNWDARFGCLQQQTCCVNENGGWFCTGA
ncbi:MAG: hypothetical protein QOF62_3874 [Pyrinomonadaceae bacterium]|nr:hypothetical protein [Pyrinomonadaceae bacterium]